MVTPIRSGALGIPLRGGVGAGGCDYCHDAGPDSGSGLDVLNNEDNHHGKAAGPCTLCHAGGNPHHGTADAIAGTCNGCHGDVVDDMSDAHYIPTYPPSMVTPFRSGAAGMPLNSNGDGAGACDYCHNDDGLPTPVIENNQNLHHGTGLDTGNCTWCHGNGDPATGTAGEQMRACEGCHGPESLHSIQADSPNPANLGTTVVGGEDAGFGHVGRDAGPGDSDCLGCHGGFITSSIASGADTIVPTIYGTDVTVVRAGTDTEVAVFGSAFTNVTGPTAGDILLTSNVELTAADGFTVTLTPNSVIDKMLVVTIPGDTPAGNYRLRATKSDVASNPTVISVTPELIITDAIFDGTTVTISGSGFSGYAAGSGTSVTGTIKVGSNYVSVEATILSWNDTTILAGFDSRPDDVTVFSVFGSAGPELVTLSKPGKGKGRGG